MHSPDAGFTQTDDVQAFVEQILRTGVTLADLVANLLDELPPDAFPGEDDAEVLLEMLSGTIRPVADAAGAQTVRRATALLGASTDRVVADLRAAADLAGATDDRTLRAPPLPPGRRLHHRPLPRQPRRRGA